MLAVLAGEHGESEVFLDTTPFYAESGGQVGDTGAIVTETGRFEVLDTQNVAGGLFAHRGRLTGEILPGTESRWRRSTPSDVKRRVAITPRRISCTRDCATVLGDHVRQQGSFVGPERLHFDFSHDGGLKPEETRDVLTLVNTDVVLNEHVDTIQTTKAEAETMGAVAFFGDKYGDRVRVVRAGRHSLEFCGGTHVDRLGDIGQIQVVSEASIGANTRRLEAVSGLGAHRRSYEMEQTLASIAALLKTSTDDVVPALERLFKRQRDVEKQVASLRQSQLSQFANELHDSSSGDVVVARVDGYPRRTACARSPKISSTADRRVVVLAGERRGQGRRRRGERWIARRRKHREVARGSRRRRAAVAPIAWRSPGGRDAKGIDAVLVAAQAL